MNENLEFAQDDHVLVVTHEAQFDGVQAWLPGFHRLGVVARAHAVCGDPYSVESIGSLVAAMTAHPPTVLLLAVAGSDVLKTMLGLLCREAMKISRLAVRMYLADATTERAPEPAAADGSAARMAGMRLSAAAPPGWEDALSLRRETPDPGLPLVSVIVRSMDRPELAQALESVALQTWPNIEVCVVCACGPAHARLPDALAGVAVRRVAADTGLDRAAAANAGLRAARGDFALFLDDDDLLHPTHLERLCTALIDERAEGGGRWVAYTGVELVDAEGASLRVLDEAWDVRRLRGANYIPIHAVLFDRKLVAERCFAFDERLACLEDWDFWLQLSTACDFIHLPGVSALYRFALGQSAISGAADQARFRASRCLVFEKWKDRLSADAWVDTFSWFDSAFGHYHQQTIELSRKGNALEHKRHLALARAEALEHEAAVLRMRLEHAEARSAHLQAQLADERQRIQAIFESTSWKVSRPIRVVKRLIRGERKVVMEQARTRLLSLGRSFYRSLPPQLGIGAKHLAYRAAGPVFKGLPSYEIWRRATPAGQQAVPSAVMSGQLVAIAEVPPLQEPSPGSIAIQLHLYYHDLADEFRASFEAMPYRFDLFVSVASAEGAEAARRSFTGMKMLGRLEVEQFPNRGRDIGPLIAGFGSALRAYDFVAHVHSKKSLYNQGATDGWRDYLCQALFGSPDNVQRVFQLLQTHGMVYPQMFWRLPYSACTWLGNAGVGRQLLARLGLSGPRTAYFDFPAGSMFWARGDTLKPLLDAGIRFEDFPDEAGQTDGTLAHAVERVLGCLHEASGRSGPAVIADTAMPSWSAWRVDQYIARNRAYALQQMDDAAVRVFIFDIFDTLLARPFCDPEHVKRVVAARAGAAGADYLRLRPEAEAMARSKAGRDVSLEEIYRHLRAMAGWDEPHAAAIMSLEREVEVQAVSPREDGVFLFNQALVRGRRIVLASDMYLDHATIESMLQRHGIAGWNALYVSSEIGLRKDTGKLFERILADEGLSPRSVLVVGDNERSDLQIPGDMGAKVIHLMRHPDLAQSLPRLSALMGRAELRSDLGWSVSMGLITRRFFSPVFYDDLDPSALFGRNDAFAIGYGVLGPLVLSFVQWLIREAKRAGHQRLWFLAREGQLIHDVYRVYAAIADGAPEPVYLRLSRRAVSVPAIKDREGIERIASENFGPAPLAMLLQERFGIDVAEASADGVRTGDTVTIRAGRIDDVAPALQALEGRIHAQAAEEREPLSRYLESLGWVHGQPQALVDVGYGGSIQYYLNALLGQPVQGYYMMTNHRTEALRSRFGVECAGCFHENVDLTADLPRMYHHNFMLEKLMSSDDAQVVRYRLDEAGKAMPEYRGLSEAELAARPLRARIREGAMAFVEDFVDTSRRLGVGVECPVELSRTLYELFAEDASPVERSLLAGLSLDDHYCGRGVVS